MMKRYLLLALLIGALSFADANAASLVGKVIEVNSGDVITIFNLNRPVRVKLLGIDAPEMNQPFGDVAKKHLSDLVHDRSVIVEYHGIAADGSLTGRVLLNNADVCAQMIRDGVAWFDPRNQDRLSSADREVYRQSELAARNERRGLWEAENPVAPWEFVTVQALKRNPQASLRSTSAGPTPVVLNRPASELTNLTLMGATQSAPVELDPRLRWYRSASSEWVRLRPAGEKFSALVPESGEQMTHTHESVKYNFYRGMDGMARFAIGWVKMPANGETDETAIVQSLKDVLSALGEGYQEVGASRGVNASFTCQPQNEKDVSMNGFTGAEFDLKACTVPSRARIFTRLVGKQRQIYTAIAFYMEEDANISRFIDSFVINKQK